MEKITAFISGLSQREYMYVAIGTTVLFIVLIMIIRYFNLRKYRKEIVQLENKMNAIQSLPIQYRLSRVQGIAKNFPEAMEKYESFKIEYEKLNEFQHNTINALINEVDDRIYSRSLKNVKSNLKLILQYILEYEKNANSLLHNIEEITEIENIQRIAIIKVKEKYRDTSDQYLAVRLKIEDFVPAISEQFKLIDDQFITLENHMNNQEFDNAKSFTDDLEKQVDILHANVRDLPTYISTVNSYIPIRLEQVHETIESMKERGFSLENFDVTKRYQNIQKQLQDVVGQIKALSLVHVGSTIESMIDELESLETDFSNEEEAFKVYQEKRDLCFTTVQQLEQDFSKLVITYNGLEQRYDLSSMDLNVDEHYKKVTEICAVLETYRSIIESNDFSYGVMITNFNQLLDEAKVSRQKHHELEEIHHDLKLQETRALHELDNITIVLLEIKAEIKNKNLPMINESYKDYIDDSYKKADEILRYTKQRPIQLDKLTEQVNAARDVIYKLYENVHNLISTAQMVEEAIVYGNRFRSTFVQVNTELTKAELLFKNGEYTRALAIADAIIEKIKPGAYEELLKNRQK